MRREACISGRPAAHNGALPDGLNYVMVTKWQNKARVVKLGTMIALNFPKVSRAINPAFIERDNGTDHRRNAWKVRKTYRFLKVWK